MWIVSCVPFCDCPKLQLESELELEPLLVLRGYWAVVSTSHWAERRKPTHRNINIRHTVPLDAFWRELWPKRALLTTIYAILKRVTPTWFLTATANAAPAVLLLGWGTHSAGFDSDSRLLSPAKLISNIHYIARI